MIPLIICGCHGSGTSYITKLLRYKGLFTGDSGKITDRKFHESISFKAINKKLQRRLKIKDLKSVTNIIKFQEKLKSDLIHPKEIEYTLNRFWKDEKRNQIWGWKDPRNSITLSFWKRIFPQNRILIIQRQVPIQKSKSSSGTWFKQHSTPAIRDLYMNPRAIAKTDKYLYIDFDQVLSDFKLFNEILQFAQLSMIRTKLEFENLLMETGFEKN